MLNILFKAKTDRQNVLFPSLPRNKNIKLNSVPKVKQAVLILSSIALCSCSAITDPYVAISKTVPASPTFAQAVTEARKINDIFFTKLTEVEKYDVGTGALLFGSGIAGLAFAAFGAHSDALIGAGLGAGTAVGARTFLPIQDRKLAYASGSAAIDCAITAFSLNNGVEEAPAPKTPVSSAKAPDPKKSVPVAEVSISKMGALSKLLLKMQQVQPVNQQEAEGSSREAAFKNSQKQRPTLRAQLRSKFTELGSISNTDGSSKEVIASTAIAASLGKKLLKSLNKAESEKSDFVATADSMINTRGQGLIAATAAIVHTVNSQIIAARIDPEAALKALRARAISFTSETKQQADELINATKKVKENSEETVKAAADAKAAGSEVAKVADKATQAAEDAEAKTNEVAQLALSIQKMVKQSTSCALGSEPG